MTNSGDRRNRFNIDVAQDLERIDDAFTRLLKDRDTWSNFLLDPNGVMVKLGLHPPASADANERTNKIFYAVLSNRELVQLALEMTEEIQSSESEHEFYVEGLRKGVIQNRIEYDLRGVNRIFSQTERVRELYQIGLYDINDKGILTRSYSRDELDDYIDRMIRGVQQGLPIRELPTLEQWDRHYGVGTGYGFGEVEVGPVATAAIAAEFAAAFTVAVAIAPAPVMSTLFREAITGNRESEKALDILSRLYDFASDLMTYVQKF